jgi:hypothetical protein
MILFLMILSLFRMSHDHTPFWESPAMTSTMSAEDTRSPHGLLPPDEKFWKRHSPHGEAPLSLAGSVALHVLAGGVLLLFALYLASLFVRSNRSLPVEAVQVVPGKGAPGGAAGKDGPGGPGEPVPDLPGGEDRAGPDDPAPLPALKPAEEKSINERFDASSAPLIRDSKVGRLLEKMSRTTSGLKLGQVAPGRAGGAPGGPGAAKKPGPGGPGDGPGGGKLTLTKRQKRMLRWDMLFTARSALEYLNQLRDLGAILAFPVEGREGQYRLVRDLRPGAPLLDEDVSKLDRIFWYDENPQSVRDVVAALRLPISPPRLFVAFMPEALEKTLFDTEKRYVENVRREKFDEDRITKTKFRVVPTARGYRPELISVTMR